MNLCDLVPFEMVALKIGTRYPTARSQLPFSKQFLYVKMKEDYKFLFFLMWKIINLLPSVGQSSDLML